jgi:hypothetical protein
MKVDAALATAVDDQVNRRRKDALAVDPRTRNWTTRDVARRLTAVGYPIAHPQVHRMRTGERKISVSEWLHIALVLSVPPVALLRECEDPDVVVDWIVGRTPLASVEEPWLYYATPLRGSEMKGSEFGRMLRRLADEYDSTDDPRTHISIGLSVIGVASGALRAVTRTQEG